MFKWLLYVGLLGVSMLAQANVVISGTRVVFPAEKKEISVQLKNQGDRPALIQAWLDNGDEQADPKTIKLPFIITPPVSRLDPQKQQILRVAYTGEPLANDRETLFFFNVLDIPPKPSRAELANNPNYLQFSVRSRLKFFFRPAGLPYSVTDAYQKAQWRVKGKTLIVQNPTPYFITYSMIEVKQNGKIAYAKNADMVAPFSSHQFELSRAVSGGEVSWSAINDYGGESKGVSPLK
ncbi:MAG: fimbria/pilus periplasmic chaperone [Pasteurellaceae bacterium]|nr:fimbria/pilus periplasmic chaperone [Pasteurellaceae bacterium]